MKDHALGCIVGALVGDAAGAPLEFTRNIKERDVDDAVRMRGGGQLHVSEGQLTDDGELTVSLAGALSGKNPRDMFPLNDIAAAYRAWYRSDPIDCGGTCGRAFAVLGRVDDASTSVGERMLANAARCNMTSEANGALMRTTPIPVWCSKESSIDVVAQYARLDASLSHPSQVCLDCNAAYCVALWSLVKTGGNAEIAWQETNDFIVYKVRNEVVKRWLSSAVDYHEPITKNIGHVKHAFCMAMNLLERPPASYEEGIRRVLRRGGDTDTNAAICGGLLGAIFGYGAIPAYMKDPVLSCAARPERYRAAAAIAFVDGVYDRSFGR